jgi:hypothetical protein
MATTRFTTNANLQVLKSSGTTQTGVSKTINLGDLQRVINVGVLGGFTTGPATTGGGATNPGTTGPSQTGGASAPPVASGPSVNLQALLAAIPIAADGQVITSDYHNSLRQALIAMASEMGIGLTTDSVAFTYAPSMLPIAAAVAWPISANFTALSAAATNPDGWLPVQLPDGKILQNMTVAGKLTVPAPTSFQVVLFREALGPDAPGPAALITVDLKSQTGGFTVSNGVTPPGAAASAAGLVAQLAAVQDLKTIDTNSYKYFLRATVTGAGAATVAEIDSIQIVVSA